MKKLVCEICDGTDFVKQDGLFCCEGCGMKYSPEEVRNMIREDNGNEIERKEEKEENVANESNKISNLSINAKRAFEDGRYDKAEQLYAEILNMAPGNAEAMFYEALSRGWQGNLVKFYFPQTIDATKRAMNILWQTEKDISVFREFVVIALGKITNLGTAYWGLANNNISDAISELNRRMADLRKYDNDWSMASYVSNELIKAKNRQDSIVAENKRHMNRIFSLIISAHSHAVDLMADREDYERTSFENIEKLLSELNKVVDAEGKTKILNVKKKIRDAVKAKEDKDRTRVLENYKDEIEIIDNYKNELLKRQKSVQDEKEKCSKDLDEARKERVRLCESEEKKEQLRKNIINLEAEMSTLGMFKAKEKKELQEQIELLSSQLEELGPVVVKERKERDETYTKIINELKSQIIVIEKKESALNVEIMEINAVLYSPDEAKIKSLAEKCKECNSEVKEEA